METSVTKPKFEFTTATLKAWIFGSGEFGRYAINALAVTYVVYYFTNVYGISPAAAGTIVLLSQILGAAWNFVFGILIDRVRTKAGKARPFILGLPILITVLLLGLYTIPFEGETAKVVWGGIMYLGVALGIGTLAVSYSVLVQLCARTNEQRLTLGNSRAFFTIATYIIFNGGMLVFVDALGGKDNPLLGFRYVALIAGVLTILLNILVYFVTKELPDEEAKEKNSQTSIFKMFKEQILGVFASEYSVKFLLSYFVYYIYITVQYSACVYFFIYQAKKPELIGPFFFATNFVTYILIPFIHPWLKKMKLSTFGVLFCGFGVVAELFRVFTGDTSIIVFFILIFLVSVSENLYFLVFPVLVSNSSDYANYKTGKKASGGNIIGAGYMVATIASGLGAAGLGYILQWAGYVKGMKETTPQLLTGINILFIWIPLTCWLLIGVIFQSWKKQNAELDEFRKNDPNYAAGATD